MPADLSSYLVMPEKECVEALIASLDEGIRNKAAVSQETASLIREMRAAKRKSGSIENFFQAYSLSTQEGIALMTLAEALLRIPDGTTANALIRDKIAGTEWGGKSIDDWMLKVAGAGLSVSRNALEGPMARLGAPVIRKAMAEGMKILGGQFVLGQTIGEALKNAAVLEKESGYLFSFDMLGEGARTKGDADVYMAAYEAAIEEIGHAPRKDGRNPGISVKLSALHPRYSFAQEPECVPALTARLKTLCRKAASYNICLTVDAEEADRLETAQKIIRAVIEDVTFTGWDGFGLAVQAYEKRTFTLIDNLIEAARAAGKRIQVRLVKGAYWDTEIKRAQMKGLEDYPVFTRKVHTDISYLACAQKLLQARDCIYPMFGTHNAYTVSAILGMAGNSGGFEFQRLFGMGDALYDVITGREEARVRIYAPVGIHRDLLPYLVRRLLENGANSSFVNKVFDPDVTPEDLAADPVEVALAKGCGPHPSIRLPHNLYAPRLNSAGINLDDAKTVQMTLATAEKAFDMRETFAASIIGGRAEKTGNGYDVRNPADTSERIGTAYAANQDIVNAAFAQAHKAQPLWNRTSAHERALILERIADHYERNTALLLSLCMREAGKTLADAVAEVREAVDFCRYYAAQGAVDFDQNGRILPSCTGERNKILLQGRGVFACISPWNFPLAIFTGQVVAALMAGNAVVAKPAEQTPFIAQAAVHLMHDAGVPESVLHLVIGDGLIGEMIVQHKCVGGVAFTGSTNAAWAINRTLAAKDSAIVPLIAETGGQNAMIADSSALAEQVVDDVITSAFGSAGQRCSACRVLFVQEDVADKIIAMLRGAMAELRVGNPQLLFTDVGPLIDEEALAALQRHKAFLDGIGRQIAQAPLSEELRRRGHYFAPVAYEIKDMDELKGEVFGPALHVIRYKAEALPAVIKSINDSGYGLTFGLHTRIDRLAEDMPWEVAAGNIYINRSTIGAVVGVQPFGGNGLSGTGPKAGGPHYLHRFATEKVVSVNTTAAGGNASLVMIEE